MGQLGSGSTGRAQRSWPVSAYLLLLALATALPVAMSAAFLAYHFVAESSQLAKKEYEDRLRLMRSATELRMANIIEDLQVLALSPTLADGRFAEFRNHAIEAVKLIGGVAIVLYAPDGQQLVNSRLGPEGPLPKRAQFDTERRAMETGQPQVSGLQMAVVDGQTIITIAVPVYIAGQIRYALNIGLSTAYLATLMDQYVSPGMVGSIIDSQGLLLARHPDIASKDLIGKPTIPEVMAHLGNPEAFWIEAISRTGVPTYTSLLRSEQTGWTINLAVPRDNIDGPLRRTIWSIAALALVTFFLGLLLARLLANRFIGEFANLERYVLGIQSGAITPAYGRISEVNRMKAVLKRVGSELADALKQQKTLLDEVNHRVKNTLGTVQSIARLSRANSSGLDEYAMAFESRLHALAEAYDLLTENNWAGARLDDIVKRTLAPFAGPDRLDISGPGVRLNPKLALAMSAAIQELSTNAAKYGAFSIPLGRLVVEWTSSPSGWIHLRWIEQGGPVVSSPTRRGFGTKMIASIFRAETGWSVDLDFDPTGLRCTMRLQSYPESAAHELRRVAPLAEN